MLDPAQLLLDIRNEICSIFTEYGELDVRILGSSEELNHKPDVDILVNLDKAKDVCILVCVRKPGNFVRKPFGAGPVRAVEWFDVCMDLVLRLRALLGCSINVIDERALKNSYKDTHSELMRRMGVD